MTRHGGEPTIATLRRRRTEARRLLAQIDAENAGRTMPRGDGLIFDKCIAELDWTAKRLRELERGR